MPFNMFPYSDLHKLNLDWILRTVKQLRTSVQELAADVAAVVRVTVQSFTSEEQQQARANIGAASDNDLTAASNRITSLENNAVLVTSQSLDATQRRTATNNIHAVSYDTQGLEPADRAMARTNIKTVAYESQDLTNSQKATARTNIGAVSSEDAYTLATTAIGQTHMVLYDSQNLSDEQKTQARTNIGAAAASAIPDVSDVLRYSAQSLTDAQKAQARNNIGVAAPGASDYVFTVASDELGTGWEVEGSLSEAASADGNVFIRFERGSVTDLISARLYYTGASLTSVTGEIGDHMAVNSNIPNTFLQITITESGGAATVTVTEIQQRQVPQPAALGADNGKVLTVHGSVAVWADRGPFRNTVSGATPTITPADNNIYICGTVTDLTISTFPATGIWSIIFESGSTATSTDFPATLNGLDDFVPETNTRYEINVLDGWAVVGSWDITPTAVE